MPAHHDFELIKVNAGYFYEFTKINVSKLLVELLSKYSDTFDRAPQIIPGVDNLPRGFPEDIPIVKLFSSDGKWSLAVSRVRIDAIRQGVSKGDSISTEVLLELAKYLDVFAEFTNVKVNRLTAIATRIYPTKSAGKELAEYFCKENWTQNSGPLSSPKEIQLHAHKTYKLNNRFNVNSWIRHMVGVASDNSGENAIIVEQDLNTIVNRAMIFDKNDRTEYFRLAHTELDKIMTLYYPK